MSTTENQDVLTLERRGDVLLMGVNRPHKRNAFNVELLMDLGRAYGLLERDEALWCGVLFAHGDHFTGGLDLAEVGPALADAEPQVSRGRPRPLAKRRQALGDARDRSSPRLVHDPRD